MIAEIFGHKREKKKYKNAPNKMAVGVDAAACCFDLRRVVGGGQRDDFGARTAARLGERRRVASASCTSKNNGA